MDEQPEQSWTAVIRTAVHEFVEAISESSQQLASASERFAFESLQAVEEAREKSQQSAEASEEMARQAQQAAEEARAAAAGLQSAVEEARETVRNETRTSVEQIANQTAGISEIGEQVKYDLQQRIEEMVARLEAGAAGYQEAMETAQAATEAAQAATLRIETSVNAVEAATAAARGAADEARRAAQQAFDNAGSVTLAVVSAQEAAESSRHSASLAEQAGKRGDFAAEASMLLERLETDYSLLTRLVQELHSRISSLSSITVAPLAPVYEPDAVDAPEYTDADAPAGEDGQAAYEAPVEAFEAPEVLADWEAAVTETSQTAYEAPVQALASSPWPEHPPADLGAASATPSYETHQPYGNEQEAASASVTISGRLQITISPVPDFDRLLSLDSALARVNGVQSVTLADYAREEVVFRVELQQPMAVADFAHQLSETAGVSTEVVEASESTLSLRIG